MNNYKPGTRKDWTGTKLHLLTFIRATEERSSGNNIKWEVECECGTRKNVVPGKVASGETKSCGCLSASGDRHRQAQTPRLGSARYVYRSYRRTDGDDISFEDFYRLSQEACHWCGILPHAIANKSRCADPEYRSRGDFTYNGLDRLDNSRGHTLDNVVPCCWECNRARSARRWEDFLAHSERIYLHSISGKK